MEILVHTFSPTLLNDFRFDWAPQRYLSQSVSLNQGWPSKLGLKGGATGIFCAGIFWAQAQPGLFATWNFGIQRTLVWETL